MLHDTGERLVLNDNWDLKTKLEHIHRYTAVSELIKGKTVLDAACGTGYGTDILSRTAAHVTGVDLSADALEFASAMFQKPNLEYRKMSVAELDFPDQSFDIVTSFETIEHISKEDQKSFLSEILRVLKEDGILFISTPNDELERQLTFGAYTNPYHICEFNEDEFEAFLKGYFKNVTMYYQSVAPTSVLIEKGKENSQGNLFSAKNEPYTERFYLAVCSNHRVSKDVMLNSVLKPKMQDFYDEQYYLRRASVYVDTGNGFDGASFSHAKCVSRDGKRFSYHFDLREIHNIQAIRFDPMEHAGMIRISALSSNISGISIRPANADSSINGVDIFSTMDPIYILMGDNIMQIESLDIEGEILHEIPDHIAWNNKEGNIKDALERIDRNENRIKELERKETNVLISMLQEQQHILNEIRTKELEHKETNVLISMLQEQQHTLNDMYYVMQHSYWYHKALQQVEHPTIVYRLAKALRMYGFVGTGKKAVKKIIKKIYKISRKNRCMKWSLKLINRIVQKLFPKWGTSVNQTLFAAKIQMNQTEALDGIALSGNTKCWCGERPIPFVEKPLVSVIVPNYNHSAYLRERLESIYNQTYPNFEVILLDDCSTDKSREILLEYANQYPDKTIVDFNEVNGGKVFKQWNKGINHAKGKLIWIAESDDWCELDFLEKMVPQFEYQSVMLAFCNSIFMQDGERIWSLGEYLADIPALKFDKPFTVSAHMAVNSAFAIKNIVPNVSSAMFRNVGEIPKEITDIWQNIKLCGDWLFYLHTIKGGTISYTNETTNYYRIHKNSTSLKIQKSPAYYQEHEQISKYVVQNYNVNRNVFDRVLNNLEQHYQAVNETTDITIVHENYNLERIAAFAEDRRPNVLMGCFSLQMGGGETYPIFLANEMKRQGICVSFLNFNLGEYSQEVRDLLSPNVPLVTLERLDHLGTIIKLTGAEIIHSHHASVDQIVSSWLLAMDSDCRQIVSLHGMYEAISRENCEAVFQSLVKTCSQFVYTADKNLSRITELGYEKKFPLAKVGNALPVKAIHPIARDTLNIGEDDFVLCLVSRAIKDKGWQEAADAVIAANRKSERKIHLLMIGDGPMMKKLKDTKSTYIHVLGQKANIRDYFAMADMGFLPSVFHGESFPLVVIDSLMAGRPVLASNIGEIQNMLMDESGKSAGALFELDNWKIDVGALADQIVDIANNPVKYQEMVIRVSSAMEKFDISKIVRTYLDIYEQTIKCKE